MAEPTLGELVKMQEEVGGTKRLRRQMKKSGDDKGDTRLSSYPPLYNTSEDGPAEEPATLRKWKAKYGSRYLTAMKHKPGDEPGTKRFKPRDPRFDSRCGEYVPEVFRSNYSFVKDMRHNEVAAMKKEMSKVGKKLSRLREAGNNDAEIMNELAEKQRSLKQLVKSSQNRLVNEERRVEQFRLINEVKTKEALESAKEGRHPHFMNRSELRQLKLAAHYRQLKESGELDKYLDRKRKKAAQNARRFRPK